MSRFPLVILLAAIFNGILWAKSVSTRTRRNAIRDREKLWPKGVIPYVLHKNFDTEQRKVIKTAMTSIESVSCIKFKERFNETAYVNITTGKGCTSTIGYTGNRTWSVLGLGCFKNNLIMHELFHVLGFYHEHSRPDRDKYINILAENVKKDSMVNFKKMSNDTVTTLGLPYDYRSILHYQDHMFSKDGASKTMVATNSSSGAQNVKIGYGEGLSEFDILKLKKLYSCPKRKLADLGKDKGSGLLEDNVIVSRQPKILTPVGLSNNSLAEQVRLPDDAVGNLWPKGVIPYVMDTNFETEEKIVIKSAMLIIQSDSCIKFKERFNEKAYVNITRGKGCTSTIGYTGIRTSLVLDLGCLTNNLVMREFVRVLGFYHEQPCDYQDQMFSKEWIRKTIGLSEFDILKLNKHYPCPKMADFVEDKGSVKLKDHEIVARPLKILTPTTRKSLFPDKSFLAFLNSMANKLLHPS